MSSRFCRNIIRTRDLAIQPHFWSCWLMVGPGVLACVCVCVRASAMCEVVGDINRAFCSSHAGNRGWVQSMLVSVTNFGFGAQIGLR